MFVLGCEECHCTVFTFFLVYLQYFAAQGQWISILSGPRGGTICTTSMGKNCSYLKYKNWKWCVYPALLLQTITDASRRRKYSPQHLSPGPDIYNIDPALSCSWNVQDFLLPPHTASLTAPLRITNLLEENYNIGSAVACSWKHRLSERSDTVHTYHPTPHLLQEVERSR